MPREDSPYVYGDHWLDKRRDGASPEVWQIATYDSGRRQVVYRSTRKRQIEAAKAVIHAHVEAERVRRPGSADDMLLVPTLFLYWRERGQHARSADNVALSLRSFLGFLVQDEATPEVSIAGADRPLFRRFIRWQMDPHAYEIEWAGRTYKVASAGVCGETVHTRLAHVAAALNHQVNEGRLPSLPRMPKVDKTLRSPPRQTVFSVEQLGAIMAVAAHNIDTFRWLALQLATGVRPDAALAFNPAEQYDATHGLVDLNPAGRARTSKRNPVVPVIDEMRPILRAWADEVRREGFDPAVTRRRAWATIRRVIDLPADTVPKTIRHSVATHLRGLAVPAIEIESLLGHEVMKGVTARYAKYDPAYLSSAKAALASLFRQVMAEGLSWAAVHSLSKSGNAPTVVIARCVETGGSSDG